MEEYSYLVLPHEARKENKVNINTKIIKFTPLSFLDGAKMYEIGYNLAISMIPKIKNDIKNFKKKK